MAFGSGGTRGPKLRLPDCSDGEGPGAGAWPDPEVNTLALAAVNRWRGGVIKLLMIDYEPVASWGVPAPIGRAGLVVSDNFATHAGSQSPPGGRCDRFLDEANATVAEGKVDATGVPASCRLPETGAGRAIRGQVVGSVIMVVLMRGTGPIGPAGLPLGIDDRGRGTRGVGQRSGCRDEQEQVLHILARSDGRRGPSPADDALGEHRGVAGSIGNRLQCNAGILEDGTGARCRTAVGPVTGVDHVVGRGPSGLHLRSHVCGAEEDGDLQDHPGGMFGAQQHTGCLGGGRVQAQIQPQVVVNGGLFEVRRYQGERGPPVEVPAGNVRAGNIGRWEEGIRIVIVVECQGDLLEIVLALQARRCFADFLHRGQKQANQDGDDGNHHQEFNEGKAVRFGSIHGWRTLRWMVNVTQNKSQPCGYCPIASRQSALERMDRLPQHHARLSDWDHVSLPATRWPTWGKRGMTNVARQTQRNHNPHSRESDNGSRLHESTSRGMRHAGVTVRRDRVLRQIAAEVWVGSRSVKSCARNSGQDVPRDEVLGVEMELARAGPRDQAGKGRRLRCLDTFEQRCPPAKAQYCRRRLTVGSCCGNSWLGIGPRCGHIRRSLWHCMPGKGSSKSPLQEFRNRVNPKLMGSIHPPSSRTLSVVGLIGFDVKRSEGEHVPAVQHR